MKHDHLWCSKCEHYWHEDISSLLSLNLVKCPQCGVEVEAVVIRAYSKGYNAALTAVENDPIADAQKLAAVDE